MIRFRLIAFGLLVAGATAHAQATRGADVLTAAEVADSLAVLHILDSTVTASPNDGAAWYRRGMIAWSLATRDKNPPPIAGIMWQKYDHMADTSLRIAAQIDPKNVYYRLAVGRHLASTFGPLNRTAASQHENAALAVARAQPDMQIYADAALDAGEIYWRFFDSKETINTVVNTRGTVLLGGASGENLYRASLDELRLQYSNRTPREDFSGEDYYIRAEGLFHEAFDVQPANPRAFRSLAAVYAARNRWNELASFARSRAAGFPWDGWAWMSLGLAEQRLDNSSAAARAFDSAMTKFSDEERHRLDKVSRILRPNDSTTFARLSDASRTATERLYWLTADPLWSKEGNEPRIEFLARVAYAELRWTYDELSVRGADTDRGTTYIRYGPPMTAHTQPPVSPTDIGYETTWTYQTGLVFVFHGYDKFVTSDPDWVVKVANEAPVRWDNIAPIHVDSIPTQISRFRARDSVDVLFAATSPFDAIRAAAEVSGGVRADYWLLAGGTVLLSHDSLQLKSPMTTSFTHRLAPNTYLFRTEATADGSSRAGRASGTIVTSDEPDVGFHLHGFGMSDVLLATRAQDRPSAARWSDIDATPLAGTIMRNSQLSVIWETYELTERNKTAHFKVTVTLRRDRLRGKTAPGRIVARIAGAVSNESTDQVTYSFDHTVPFRPIIVDNISLTLGSTPPGTYVLTVKVIDQFTGHDVTTSRDVVIVDPPAPAPGRRR